MSDDSNTQNLSTLKSYMSVLEQLTAENLSTLEDHLADDVRFIDPFNNLTGRPAFIGVMAEMFEQLDSVSFKMIDYQLQGDIAFLYWQYQGQSSLLGDLKFEGTSRVIFTAQGKVALHHDFWDASLMMQKLPLLGRVIARIRKRVGFKP